MTYDYTTISLYVAGTERELEARVTYHRHREWYSRDRTEPDEPAWTEIEDVEVEWQKGTWSSILHMLSEQQVENLANEVTQGIEDAYEDARYEAHREARGY